MLENAPPLWILAALSALLLFLALSTPGLAKENERGSLRVQLHWSHEGVEVHSVQPSREPSPDIASVATDPRSRIAEHITNEGFWSGQPVSTGTGASVVHLPRGLKSSQVLAAHRTLGIVELDVAQGDDFGSRGLAPELIAIRESGEPATRQDWVFLGDGYQETERGQFLADIENNLSYLENIAPYSRYLSLVNVWALFIPSPESGVDHLEADPPTYADTPLGCHYGAYGIARLIDCDADAVLEASSFAPGEDVRIVLVNDPTYGGSGGSEFAVAYNGEDMVQAVVHEMAHSDGRLADEYSYEVSSDPPTWGTDFPNCSPSATDPPWVPWIHAESEGVGTFAACSYTDYFRPTDNACLMRELQDAFCVVCRESLVRTIYGHLDRLILEEDADPIVLEDGDATTLEVITIEVFGEPLHFTWLWIQDEDQDVETTEILLAEGAGLDELTLSSDDLSPGTQTIVVRVEDRIDWMLTDHPESMTDERRFTLQVDAGAPEDSDDDDSSVGAGCQGCAQPGLAPLGPNAELLFLSLLLSLKVRRNRVRGSPSSSCPAVL